MQKKTILTIVQFLDWMDLKNVSEVLSLFQRLAEDISLHRDDFIKVDVTEVKNTNSYDYLRYVFKIRNISKVQITDVTSTNKNNQETADAPKIFWRFL